MKNHVEQHGKSHAGKSRAFWLIYAAAIFLFSLGCVAGGSKNVEVGAIGICGTSAEHWGEGRGEAGYLGFYHAVDAVDLSSNPLYYQFNPFLMEGSFGTYYVSHWATGEQARIVEVTSSNPGVIAVAPIHQSDQDYFDVAAIRPGTAELTVQTALGTADRLVLTVTDLASVDAGHCCATSSRAMYLTGSEVEVPVTYFSSYGETPIGFGRLPFEISDESRLTWLSGAPDPANLHFKTGGDAGIVTLNPVVPGEPITMELVAPRDLDGISVHWQPDPASVTQWFVGAVLYVDDMPLCAGKYPMRATSQTPNICRFINADAQSVSRIDFAGDETVLVEAFSSGDCAVTVQLLDDQGQAIRSQTSNQATEISAAYSDRDSGPY
jgi:hypothetical protein